MKNQNDRDRAILWARETMEKDFIVLDTETTGFAPETGDEAVSIGIVAKGGAVLLDTLLRHRKRSVPEAERTHGHTWLETRQAPPWADVLPTVRRLVGDKPVVAYNGNYDARIVLATCAAHETEALDLRDRIIDVMEPFAKFYGEWNDYHGSYKWQRLTTAAAHFAIDTAGAHGAAADALMTLRVVERMAACPISACVRCGDGSIDLNASGVCDACADSEEKELADAAEAELSAWSDELGGEYPYMAKNSKVE